MRRGEKAALEGGELYAVISSSSFVVMRLKRVGHKVAFVECKVSGGIRGALHSYCICVEVRSVLKGGLAQRSGPVPIACRVPNGRPRTGLD